MNRKCYTKTIRFRMCQFTEELLVGCLGLSEAGGQKLFLKTVSGFPMLEIV